MISSPTLRRGVLVAVVSAVAAIVTAASGAATLPGLAHHYTGDGTPNDAAGGAHATWIGPAAYATGSPFGSAFSLVSGPGAAGGSYLDLGTTVGNFGTGDFTIAFWMNTATLGQQAPLFAKRPSNLGILQLQLYNRGLVAELRGPGTNGDRFVAIDATASGLTVDDGAWHHVALTRQGTNATLYLDGGSIGTTTGLEDANLSNAGPLTFGKVLLFDGLGYTGLLDDIQLYGRGLSAPEVATLMTAPPPPPPSPAQLLGQLVEHTLDYAGASPLGPVLQARLDAAIAALVAGKPASVCRALLLYDALVRLTPTSVFSATEKTALLAESAAIRAALGCA